MYQILQLTKDNNYKSKMMLIFCDDIQGMNAMDAGIHYTKHWGKIKKELENKIVDLSPASMGNLPNEINLYGNITTTIMNFILIDMANTMVPKLDQLRKEKFKPILQFISRPK